MVEILAVTVMAAIAISVVWSLLAWNSAPVNRVEVRTRLLQRLLRSGFTAELVHEDEKEVQLHIGEHRCCVYLQQLYLQCSAHPNELSVFIQQAAEAIAMAIDEGELPEEWRRNIMPMLMRPQVDTPPEMVIRPAPPMLAVGYALVTETSFRWFTQPMLEVSGCAVEELHTIALANLERSCNMLVIDTPQDSSEDDNHLLRFHSHDGLDAARVLLPTFFQRFSPRFADADILVAIPSRDVLIMVPADDPAQANLLAWHARREFGRVPYPLLDTLLLITEQGIMPWVAVGSYPPLSS